MNITHQPQPHTEQPPPSLSPLPAPLLLLTLSLSALSQLHSILPSLAQAPTQSSSSSLTRYAQHWNNYLRLRSEALQFAHCAVEASAAQGGGTQNLVVGLRARGVMVEYLVMGRGEADLREAERVIAKALSIASSHASLFTFQLAFLSHQANIALLSSPPNPKFARTTLKRALSLLDRPPQSISASARAVTSEDYPEWRYHFLIQLAQVACPEEGAADFASAYLAWREVERFASQRGDLRLSALAQLSLARLAVERNDSHTSELTEELVTALGVTLGFASEDLLDDKSEPPELLEARKERSRVRMEEGHALLPGTLRVQAALLYCLWRAQEGVAVPGEGGEGLREGATAEAKVRLKEVHRWLDEKRAASGEGEREFKERKEGEEAGYVKIPINPPATQQQQQQLTGTIANALPTPANVTVRMSPRSVVYRYAFLVSVAVYRDPFGAKPKSAAFAKEGLRMVDNSLSGADKLAPGLQPAQVPQHLRSLASLRLALLLSSAEIALLRSQFLECQDQLNSAISTARTHNLWSTIAPRVCLIQGMLAHAQGEDAKAFEVLEAVEAGRTGEDRNARLGARLALLMMGMAQGLAVRLDSLSNRARGTGNVLMAQEGSDRTKARLELDELARRFVDEAHQGPPAWRLAAHFVEALARGEITKSKEHLSQALSLANQGGANHAKALMLALLGNLYLHTRNDQALKMLKAADSIARGLGARKDERSAERREEDKRRGKLGDEVVGAAGLGLWCGERMAGIYADQGDARALRIQTEINEAHRRVLRRETVAQ